MPAGLRSTRLTALKVRTRSLRRAQTGGLFSRAVSAGARRHRPDARHSTPCPTTQRERKACCECKSSEQPTQATRRARATEGARRSAAEPKRGVRGSWRARVFWFLFVARTKRDGRVELPEHHPQTQAFPLFPYNLRKFCQNGPHPCLPAGRPNPPPLRWRGGVELRSNARCAPFSAAVKKGWG